MDLVQKVDTYQHFYFLVYREAESIVIYGRVIPNFIPLDRCIFEFSYSHKNTQTDRWILSKIDVDLQFRCSVNFSVVTYLDRRVFQFSCSHTYRQTKGQIPKFIPPDRCAFESSCSQTLTERPIDIVLTTWSKSFHRSTILV